MAAACEFCKRPSSFMKCGDFLYFRQRLYTLIHNKLRWNSFTFQVRSAQNKRIFLQFYFPPRRKYCLAFSQHPTDLLFVVILCRNNYRIYSRNSRTFFNQNFVSKFRVCDLCEETILRK